MKANNILSRISERTDDPGMVAIDRAGKAMLPDLSPDTHGAEFADWGKADMVERAAKLRKAAQDATKLYRELVSLSNFYHRKGIAAVDRTLASLHSEIEELTAQAEHLSLTAKAKKK